MKNLSSLVKKRKIKMSNTQIIDDEFWDYYSGLPNPMWYQHITEIDDEEEDTSNNNDTTIDTE